MLGLYRSMLSQEKEDVKLKEGRVRGINRFFIEMIFDRGGERSALGSFLEIVNTHSRLGLSSHHLSVLTVTIRGETQLSNSYQLSMSINQCQWMKERGGVKKL